jgi:hypothetical protein
MKRLKIILDKSYLRGVCERRLIEISGEMDLIFTRMLMYEILSDKDTEQAEKLFSKLKSIARHIYYTPHVGRFLKNELKYLKPTKNIILNNETNQLRLSLIMGSLHFNDAIRKIESEVQTEEPLAEHRMSVYQHVIEAFPELKELERGMPREQALPFFRLLFDARRFMKFCGDLFRYSNIGIPLKKLSPQWVWFRYLQYEFLADAELIRTYGFEESNPNLKKVTNLGFDLHYAVLAGLVDGLSTRDEGLKFFFRIGNPDKIIIDT